MLSGICGREQEPGDTAFTCSTRDRGRRGAACPTGVAGCCDTHLAVTVGRGGCDKPRRVLWVGGRWPLWATSPPAPLIWGTTVCHLGSVGG